MSFINYQLFYAWKFIENFGNNRSFPIFLIIRFNINPHACCSTVIDQHALLFNDTNISLRYFAAANEAKLLSLNWTFMKACKKLLFNWHR